jgi:hypothetical protein
MEIIMSEYANNTHKRSKVRSIEDVPAFRQHLERNGLRNLAEWEARQSQRQGLDADAESLALHRRYVRIKARGRAATDLARTP